MVRHTHQDFLPEIESDGDIESVAHISCEQIESAEVRLFTEEVDLFDLNGRCSRKVPLSYLDTFIDDQSDWNRFLAPLHAVNVLYLIDDRIIINPIMHEYAAVKNEQYVKMLQREGITGVVVKA